MGNFDEPKKNDEKIMVSICCLVYNHEKYLRECLEGFVTQKTNFKFEVLIHDDASTDSSVAIIKEYEEKYPDIIKPIYQKENQHSKGVRISMQNQYPRAKGKYIALCEGDDCWCDNQKLQRQVEYLECHDDFSMCFHAAKVINCKTNEEEIQCPYQKNSIAPTSDIILGGGLFVPTASIVFRRKYIMEIPEYFYKADIGDYPLQLHLASKGKIYFFNNVMSVYRFEREGSWTVNNRKQSNEKKIQHLKIESEWLEDFNKETSYQYSKEIAKRILFYQYSIYKLGEKNSKMIFLYAKKVSKWQYIKTLIRVGMIDVTNVANRIKRWKSVR